ncbi:MAG: energy-coupling factor ABC transporter ATP-binding protein [Actinomycetia bacterium]|nr:energy-coupling factor ABC transporter ATP-binding protein [Actinomycetes bacterium]
MSLFALKDVAFADLIRYPDIEIAEGRVTYLVGESGVGKTTLLRLLNGVASASAGEVLYRGNPVESYDPVELRREVLLCGQAPWLFSASVRENFAQYYRYRDLDAPDDEMALRFLRLCAADFDLDADCSTLSGGERQRVFIAICLSLAPAVLLLDEPTSALDDATAHRMMGALKAYCTEEAITLVVVSHNSAQTHDFADDRIELSGGAREH